MNNSLQVFSYEGNQVTFKNESGVTYVNATQMAKPFGKKPAHYLELPSTQELIGAIVGKSDISKSDVVIAKRGSSLKGGGTWLHELIALDFAQWLSVDFKLWCNEKIKELLTTGTVSIMMQAV